MSSFLTVEDMNGVNIKPLCKFYKMDTSLISDTDEFSGVLYDFISCSHSVSGSDHTFTFQVMSNLWNGFYYILDKDGDLVDDAVVQYNDGVLTIVTTEESICLYLLLCNFTDDFALTHNPWYLVPNILSVNIMDTYWNDTHFPVTIQYPDGSTEIEEFSFEFGDIENGSYVDTYDNDYPYLVNVVKCDLPYSLTGDLIVGRVNRLTFSLPTDLMSVLAASNNPPLHFSVEYNGENIPVTHTESSVYFDLDLSDKLDDSNVQLNISLDEHIFFNSSSIDYSLPCSYSSASTFNELKSLILAGTNAISLIGDITFTESLNIPENTFIKGNGHTVSLAEYGMLVNKSVKCENTNFNNGVNCFIQYSNSKLVLTDCNFNNAIISDNYKGSVVSSNDRNVTCEITNCNFNNCHHSIYTSGDLTITDCKALFNDYDSEVIDTDYSAFLTAYDADVTITGSVFDIDYDTNYLCTNQLNIKFAQSLISISEDTIFNNVLGSNLKNNNVLSFFNAPYNNRSHVYCKYYYPQITNCVISSPVVGSEDKSVCHSVIGTDWVYKNNVQVTKVDEANNIRKITWEDI